VGVACDGEDGAEYLSRTSCRLARGNARRNTGRGEGIQEVEGLDGDEADQRQLSAGVGLSAA
jgi:hypothetical protein